MILKNAPYPGTTLVKVALANGKSVGRKNNAGRLHF